MNWGRRRRYRISFSLFQFCSRVVLFLPLWKLRDNCVISFVERSTRETRCFWAGVTILKYDHKQMLLAAFHGKIVLTMVCYLLMENNSQ